MNPVFIFLVIIGAVILWFALNSLFPIIGEFFCGLFEETKENMNDRKENKK